MREKRPRPSGRSSRSARNVRILVLLRRLRASPEGAIASSLLGPCEEAALGTALALRTAAVASGRKATVEALAVGPPIDDGALAFALECGVERAFRLWAPELEGTDYWATAQVLAAAAQKRRFTWIVCGDRSADECLGATGPAVAELLAVPHLGSVREVRLSDDGSLLAACRSDGLLRELEVPPPAVLCVGSGPIPLAPPSPPATANARRKPRPRLLPLADLGLLAEQFRHRQRFLGVAVPRSGATVLVDSAEDLLARLKSDGIL